MILQNEGCDPTGGRVPKGVKLQIFILKRLSNPCFTKFAMKHLCKGTINVFINKVCGSPLGLGAEGQGPIWEIAKLNYRELCSRENQMVQYTKRGNEFAKTKFNFKWRFRGGENIPQCTVDRLLIPQYLFVKKFIYKRMKFIYGIYMYTSFTKIP